MNLVIDIGNTQVKLCVFHNSEIVFHTYLKNIKYEYIQKLLNEYTIERIIYSDTRGVNKSEFIENMPEGISLIELTSETKLPIKIDYETPGTLGKDRIAGAVSATVLFNSYPCLIIDVGTALTIDFVSKESVFMGGIISPGPEMRFKALHEFTGKLPKEQAVEKTELLGRSTQTAIQYGVQNGVLYEINGYISRFKEQYPELKVILTGGYAFLFEKK